MKKRIRKPLTAEQKRRKLELQLARRRAQGVRPTSAEEHGRKLNEGKAAWLANASDAEKRRIYEEIRSAANAKGPRHELALCWSLKAPDGRIYQFKNLVHFVRTNGHLFSEYELEERKYGRNLAVPRISRLLVALSPRGKHPRETVHGWQWHINREVPESYLATG